MTILDSNVWIAQLHRTDNQHAKANDAFSLITEKILLPEYLIMEICSVLNVKMEKELANKFLQHTMMSEDVEIALSNELFFFDVVKTFQEYPKYDLSFADTALLLLSRSHTVITFDKKLERAIQRNTE